MRRAYALLVVPLIVLVATVTGCGSSSPSSSANASSSLYSKTVIQGTGATLTSADSFVGNYAAYVWSGKTHKLAMSTYTTHTPSLFSGQLLPGLSAALKGAKEGSRVLAVIPPKQGFGSTGNSQLGIKGTDTLVFVIDLVKTFSNTAGATGT